MTETYLRRSPQEKHVNSIAEYKVSCALVSGSVHMTLLITHQHLPISFLYQAHLYINELLTVPTSTMTSWFAPGVHSVLSPPGLFFPSCLAGSHFFESLEEASLDTPSQTPGPHLRHQDDGVGSVQTFSSEFPKEFK